MQIKVVLRRIIEENKDNSASYKRNLLREYLQVLILSYIYSSKKYSNLFFYGGTCLKHCYDLPRLSGGLDFVDTSKNVSVADMAQDVALFLEKEGGITVEAKVQKFRAYFKFPILKELGVATEEDSDYLFVKAEVFSDFDFCAGFREEFKPIFKFNHSFLVKTFDLPTLMSTKIRAVLYRRWEKTAKNGTTLAAVKGRDYFDLLWFLQKKIEPNYCCIEDVDNKEQLKKRLLEAVKEADDKSIEYDLQGFIKGGGVVGRMKSVVISEIEGW